MGTVSPNLLNMPEVVMKEILEKLDLRNIVTLRKVCKPLLLFIDSQNSIPELIDLSIFVNFEKIEVCSNSLKNQSINLEKIENLDQWKSAKNLSIDNFILEISLEKLFHFSFLDVKLRNVDAEILMDLRNKFLESTDPKEFIFTFMEMKNQEKLLEFLGIPEILKNIFGLESQRWKLQYPGTNEKFLEIQISKNYCKFTNIESLEEQVRRRREEAEQLENSGN
ncbi:hypothetical protein B9Z55_026832 [Caenorhabditis nigoni]|uniref:F-box domain-containing protein n=1 Tax=Caenorhabditis nigoni TaxID=1611254 RepID=A0A2G5SHH2_9PELO|nr:hypothetical protein B9Z55_026832 [Caenorhabditis nigoni]